ncbi:hypothetical protein COLO4_25464 [Corchorus olitorius]|uniref:Uncharacterized protein n=1 Tax=Corchorus olitorius TaxID=93759 RepID=A0A1R3I2E6_9ROSI|nr:hypothetical protein COLO4_25464 [Corchorus olitorius]
MWDCEGLERGKDAELAVIGVAYLATAANFEVFSNPRQSCHVTVQLELNFNASSPLKCMLSIQPRPVMAELAS